MARYSVRTAVGIICLNLIASVATTGVAPGQDKKQVTKDQLVGKWLMRDGVIEFRASGEFINLGDKHGWEMDGGDLVLKFGGEKQRRTVKLSGDRLTLGRSDGSASGSIRLDPKKYGSGTKWQTKDLQGEWAADDTITLKLDAGGKGDCSSQIRVGETDVVNFELASVAIIRVDDIHVLTMQKMKWIVLLAADRKSIDLIAANDKAVSPSTVTLKRK